MGLPQAQRSSRRDHSSSTRCCTCSSGLRVLRPQQMRKPLLRREPALDRQLLRRAVRQPVAAVRRPRRAARSSVATAASTTCAEMRGSWPQPSGQSVSTFRNAGPSASPGLRGLAAEVVPVRARRLRDVRDVVRDGDRGHVLALLRLAQRLEAGRARRRRGSERCRARALDAGVHVRLVVVADEHEAVAALERAGERLQADVVRAAVAGEDDERRAPRRSRLRLRSARYADSTPLATAAEFSNATCSHGTFHAVVGKRVVATSRQPVALITTVGVAIESSTVRTTIGMPQPWHSE